MNQNKSFLMTQQKLQDLSDNLLGHIDEIFESFDISLEKTGRMYVGVCPIHSGSDNISAFNLYHSGAKRGKWYCRTHNCQQVFASTVLGLVRALLSKQHTQWSQAGDPVYSFRGTLDYAHAVLKNRVIPQPKEEDKFNSVAHIYSKKKNEEYNFKCSQTQLKQLLQIPAPYYLGRGYSKEILERYEVGYCNTFFQYMMGRAVAPIYDEQGKNIIGLTGRSVNKLCSECKCYHIGDCPPQPKRRFYSKWKFNPGFQAENHLYNLWFARPHIEKTGVAIIVESPGNIWRLEEADIHLGVGQFGTYLKPQQLKLLNRSGAMSLIVLTDNDSAGKEAAKQIKESCESLYNLRVPKFEKNDIGEMSIAEVKEEILPIVLDEIERLGVLCEK